jgi:hypothetical protein
MVGTASLPGGRMCLVISGITGQWGRCGPLHDRTADARSVEPTVSGVSASDYIPMIRRSRCWRRGQESPHFSNWSENVREQGLLLEHLGETLHQWPKPVVTHGWDEIVEHAALAEQRVDTAFGGVGLECTATIWIEGATIRMRSASTLEARLSQQLVAGKGLFVVAGSDNQDGMSSLVLPAAFGVTLCLR